MFEGDCADMCATKCPLVSMGAEQTQPVTQLWWILGTRSRHWIFWYFGIVHSLAQVLSSNDYLSVLYFLPKLFSEYLKTFSQQKAEAFNFLLKGILSPNINF
jgi:hypothetical protein